MFSVFKSLTGFFPSESHKISIKEAIELINEKDKEEEVIEIKNEEPVDKQMCFKRTGRVLYVDHHGVMIENEKFFEDNSIDDLEIGDIVSYMAYMNNDEVKISSIIGKIYGGDKQQEENNLWMTRRFVGKVVEKNERNLKIEPGSYTCDLDKVKTEFVPIVGDWLNIEAITQVDEKVSDLCSEILEIVKISPMRINIATGIIRKWSDELKEGIIDTDIYFDKYCCVPGYMPMIRDQVSVKIIESDQEPCTWRALRVDPKQTATFTNYTNITDTSTEVLLHNKNGIEISEPGKLLFNKIGESSNVKIEVKNTSNIKKNIIGCYFKNTNFDKSQLRLIHPELDDCLEIESHKSITFTLMCTAKNMGITNELFVFQFDDFEIGRFIIIDVVPHNNLIVAKRTDVQKNQKEIFRNAKQSILKPGKNNILGQKPVRAPVFMTNVLLPYGIPQRIKENLFNELGKTNYRGEIPIENISPVLAQNLDFRNYSDRFHDLVYLEELALQINLHKYDMDRACFIRNGEYLMLEVPDLSERRPSIIIGDKIIAYDPSDTKTRYEGYVHKTAARHVYIKFHNIFHEKYNDEDYRVEFKSSRTNFRRYHQAIDLAVRQLGKEFLFPNQIKLKPSQINFVIDDDSNIHKACNYIKNIRRILMKTSPIKQDKENQLPEVTLRWFDKSLNMYQRRAVENILKGEARPLPYFIFGPPGTGKTVTLIETILQILKLMPQSKLLVATPSNSAADLIALRLLDSGVLEPGDLVRMVAFRCLTEGMIPERLVPYCVTGGISREGSQDSTEDNKSGVTIGMQASELGRYKIIVGTCMTVGNIYTMGFTKGHFTHILIDEAGQLTEPEMLIPLSLLDVKSAQTVLAGDPLQLGPCLFSRLSESHGLSKSFFERLIFKFPYVKDQSGFSGTSGYDERLITRLVYNYRSLPEILGLPNMLFYDSDLKPTISQIEGEEVDLLKQVAELLPEREGKLPPSIVFHGVRGENYQLPDSPSWFNLAEAGQVFYYVNDLYSAGIKPQDIGVITPYVNQGHQVRLFFKDAELEMPKIGSVEEFQGQEFKVIILSTVRSNEAGATADSKYGLGFIASPRRLNVAITRAKALLIIVGNPHLLASDKYWRSVLTYSIKIGGYRGCDLPDIFNKHDL